MPKLRVRDAGNAQSHGSTKDRHKARKSAHKVVAAASPSKETASANSPVSLPSADGGGNTAEDDLPEFAGPPASSSRVKSRKRHPGGRRQLASPSSCTHGHDEAVTELALPLPPPPPPSPRTIARRNARAHAARLKAWLAMPPPVLAPQNHCTIAVPLLVRGVQCTLIVCSFDAQASHPGDVQVTTRLPGALVPGAVFPLEPFAALRRVVYAQLAKTTLDMLTGGCYVQGVATVSVVTDAVQVISEEAVSVPSTEDAVSGGGEKTKQDEAQESGSDTGAAAHTHTTHTTHTTTVTTSTSVTDVHVTVHARQSKLVVPWSKTGELAVDTHTGEDVLVQAAFRAGFAAVYVGRLVRVQECGTAVVFDDGSLQWDVSAPWDDSVRVRIPVCGGAASEHVAPYSPYVRGAEGSDGATGPLDGVLETLLPPELYAIGHPDAVTLVHATRNRG